MSEAINLKDHWNRAYNRVSVDQLGWFEAEPTPSLKLIRELKLAKNARQLHVGVGASTLIDKLLDDNYSGLIASDISEDGLDELKDRLGQDAALVEWIVDDLTAPEFLQHLEPVDLWHDRAVLHFFTQENDRRQYAQLLNRLVKPGGYVIIAAFSLDGADKCSGLPVYRYNQEMLQELLGSEYTLMKAFNYDYHQPSGNLRKYIYTCFRCQHSIV